MNAESTVTSYRGQIVVQVKVLKHVYDLNEELAVFFTEKGVMDLKDSAKMRNRNKVHICQIYLAC
jgi:hypothetical protein